MLAADGTFEGRRILSAESVQQMTTVRTEPPQRYGFGFTTDGNAFGHGGAYGTNTRYDRRTGLITIFLLITQRNIVKR